MVDMRNKFMQENKELKSRLAEAEQTLEKIADLFRTDTCCPHGYTALEMVTAWRDRWKEK